ncbi:hypothetical protein E4T56_gene16443, partial [Termitomyces sp. T112]
DSRADTAAGHPHPRARRHQQRADQHPGPMRKCRAIKHPAARGQHKPRADHQHPAPQPGQEIAAHHPDAEHRAKTIGHMQKAREQRGLPPLGLKREGKDQKETGPGRGKDDGQRQPFAKGWDGKQRRIEQGGFARLHPPPDMAPCRPAQRPDRQQGQEMDRPAPSLARPDQRPEQGRHGQHKQAHANQIVTCRAPRPRLGQEHQPRDHRAQSDRQIDQEHHPPAQLKQIGLDQHAAQNRPGNRRQPADHAKHRHARDTFERLEQYLHQRHGLRRHDRSRRPLKQPRGNQLRSGRGQPAPRRGERETDHPDNEHSPIAIGIPQPAPRHQQECKGQRVARHDPLRGLRIGPQTGLDGGQRGVDDRHVDDLQHQRDDQCDKRQCLLPGREHAHRRMGGPRGQRHIGERRVLARAGRHLRAIGDKQIGNVMRLAPLVEHAGLRVMAHARAAHFVDRRPARPRLVKTHDDLAAGGGEHFGRLGLGLCQRGMFLFAKGEIDLELGQAVGIGLAPVQRQPVAGTRHAIGKAHQHHAPRAGMVKLLLIVRADPRHSVALRPCALQP